MTSPTTNAQKLAIHGGTPARQQPDPPMFPGGMIIAEEEEAAVLDVLRSKRLFRFYGPLGGESKVEALEKAFAATVGVKRALAVTSGTAALICGLLGVGVGPGDEVIVPAYTWIASATAVLAVGGIPIVAEVDESLTLDPADVAAKITPYTKAILPVHMRGAPSRMDELMALARQHNLRVVEDCAQGNGASYKGQKLGSIGDVGCFSLQFSKIITTGEGGVVTTNDEAIWQRAFMYHDVSAWNRLELPEEEILWGANFRMSELPAAVGLVQLQRLDGLVTAIQARQRMLLGGIAETAAQRGVTFRDVPDPAGDSGVNVFFFVETPEKAEQIAAALRAENISAGQVYRPDRRDFHVYAHWFPVLEKRAWTPDGSPWRWAQREIEYSPDMCPRSLDLLGRAVMLNVNPLLSNAEMEETIDGVNKVLDVLA